VFSASLGSDAGSVGMSMFVHWVCRRCQAEERGGGREAQLILWTKQDAGSALCICPLTQAARSGGGIYEGFVQANRNDDRTLGIQIVGLYPNMPGSGSHQPRRINMPIQRLYPNVEQRPAHLLLGSPVRNRPTRVNISPLHRQLRPSGRTQDQRVP
jgi:hypothetical protein